MTCTVREVGPSPSTVTVAGASTRLGRPEKCAAVDPHVIATREACEKCGRGQRRAGTLRAFPGPSSSHPSAREASRMPRFERNARQNAASDLSQRKEDQ